MKKLKAFEKIEYSDLFKLIKIGDKELNEANVQKYFEIICLKASQIDKGNNIYVQDDLNDFICSVATIIPLVPEKENPNNENKENNEKNDNNILIKALQYVLMVQRNYVLM